MRLAKTQCTPDLAPETWERIHGIYTTAGTPVRFRTKEEVLRFFDGLDLIEPGLTICHRWRPDEHRPHAVDSNGDRNGNGNGNGISDAAVSLWAGVGIKP